MGISTINSQYVGLNGLSGYSTSFTGTSSLYSSSYVDDAKENIANSYEVSATSSSYSNKSSVSSSSYTQQCQAIQYLLEQGRTDDAMEKYNELYEDMASNTYYSAYSENELKTLLQSNYLTATGTTLVNDISSNSSSDFTTGLESSIPVLGLLFNDNSADDFIAEATGTDTSGWSKVKKALGVVTGTGLCAAVGAGVVAGINKAKGSTTSKVIGAVIGGGAALLTYFGGKLINSAND